MKERTLDRSGGRVKLPRLAHYRGLALIHGDDEIGVIGAIPMAEVSHLR